MFFLSFPDPCPLISLSSSPSPWLQTKLDKLEQEKARFLKRFGDGKRIPGPHLLDDSSGDEGEGEDDDEDEKNEDDEDEEDEEEEEGGEGRRSPRQARKRKRSSSGGRAGAGAGDTAAP